MTLAWMLSSEALHPAKRLGFDQKIGFVWALTVSILKHPIKVAVGDVDCILYFDCTKLGALTQGEVNLIGDYAEKILFKNTKRLVPSWFLLSM